MKTETTAFNPKLYIGIDVHKKSWTFHYQTDLFDGKTITQPASPDKLVEWVEKQYPKHEVTCAYEAGFSGYSAARLFQQQKLECISSKCGRYSSVPKTKYRKNG